MFRVAFDNLHMLDAGNIKFRIDLFRFFDKEKIEK